jgi:hypothetical protein
MKIKYKNIGMHLFFSAMGLILLFIIFLPLPKLNGLKLNASVDGNSPSIKLELEQQYGSSNATGDELIGMISAFFVNENKALYIIDNAFKKIKMFSEDGKLLKTFGKGPGKGPGELNGPNGIAVDSMGNIYIIDKINQNITVFDSLNNLLTTQTISFIPSQIIAVSPMIVDILGFGFSYRGNMIYRYNLKNANSADTVFTYCERLDERKMEIGFMTGNSGRLLKDSRGNIFTSFYYPYRIFKFSSEGKLLMTIKEVRNIDPPIIDPTSRQIRSSTGIRGLGIFEEENVLLILVSKTSDDEYYQYFDFFTLEQGEYLGSISCKALGLDRVRYLCTDNDGKLYLDIVDPYPHILRYKVLFDFF